MNPIQITKTPISISNPYYEIFIKMDYNDADYISDTIQLSTSDFENDELKLLVLSYLIYEQRKHIAEDKNFPWLEEYLNDNDLLLSTEWESAHSYESICITYHNIDGSQYKVSISKPSEIFESKEEMKEYMNNLYHQNYD